MSVTQIQSRLIAKSENGEGGCWLWLGASYPEGYGCLNVDGRTRLAHRVSHEVFIGPIPPGYEVDHLCRVTGCINPAHLEAVTGEENRRRKYAAITHCKSGHRYDTANTYIRPNGRRDCRACIRDRVRRYKARSPR